jgi:DTW domain-containing protein YfiP
MCKYIKPFETDTKFVILMHPKEFKKVKNNTGHFTHLSLKNSELFVGVDFSNNKRINEIIQTYDSFILFPSKDAINLTDTNIKKDTSKKLAIFLIDSTWTCINKMLKQSVNLQNLNFISFNSSRTSQYKIKMQPKSNYLSTIESTLVVLELLNNWGIESIEKYDLDNFLNPFIKMINYQEIILENPDNCDVRFKKR